MRNEHVRIASVPWGARGVRPGSEEVWPGSAAPHCAPMSGLPRCAGAGASACGSCLCVCASWHRARAAGARAVPGVANPRGARLGGTTQVRASSPSAGCTIPSLLSSLPRHLSRVRLPRGRWFPTGSHPHCLQSVWRTRILAGACPMREPDPGTARLLVRSPRVWDPERSQV